jgi:hypothetical protein
VAAEVIMDRYFLAVLEAAEMDRSEIYATLQQLPQLVVLLILAVAVAVVALLAVPAL